MPKQTIFLRNLSVQKKYKVIISQTAQNDLEHIFFYIAEDSINKAKKFVLDLEKKIYSLETFPERFAYVSENVYLGSDYRHLIHKKYRVIYRFDKQNVYILRVIQGSKLLDI